MTQRVSHLVECDIGKLFREMLRPYIRVPLPAQKPYHGKNNLDGTNVKQGIAVYQMFLY